MSGTSSETSAETAVVSEPQVLVLTQVSTVETGEARALRGRGTMLKPLLLCSLMAEAASLSFGALGAQLRPATWLPLAHSGVSMGLVRQVRLAP